MKRVIIGIASVAILLMVIATGENKDPQSVSLTSNQSSTASSADENADKSRPTCDGATVTSDCVVDGVSYSIYVYHPAVPEKSHTETVTTYKQEVSGYCTLCVDGTYSPSCATGRGACSHHGGVAQWNAPRYTNVPVHTTKTVVDASAQAAYYEKVVE